MNKSIPIMIKTNFNNELLNNPRKQIGYSHEVMSIALGYKSPHGDFYLEKGWSRVQQNNYLCFQNFLKCLWRTSFTKEETVRTKNLGKHIIKKGAKK